MLTLPFTFVKFYFVLVPKFFYSFWKKTLDLLDHDLSLYHSITDLFHSVHTSFADQLFDFIAKVFKILIGLFAFTFVTACLIILLLIYLFSPLFLLISNYRTVGLLIIAATLIVFLYLHFSEPKNSKP